MYLETLTLLMYGLYIIKLIQRVLFAVPMEMAILTKEHFNRWYSLKSFFISVNVVDFPIPVSIQYLTKSYI